MSTMSFFTDGKTYYSVCPPLTLELSRLPPLDENPKWNPDLYLSCCIYLCIHSCILASSIIISILSQLYNTAWNGSNSPSNSSTIWFRNLSDWQRWKRRFQQFREASGPQGEFQSKQVNTLLYCMGEEAEAVLSTTKATEDDRKTYYALLANYSIHRHW